MKVQKFFRFPGSATHCVVRIDGNYYEFRNTPARHVTADELQPCPHYQEKGNRAEDMPEYMYKIYGLEKA